MKLSLVNICTNCNKYLAISPEGLCNICDEEALQKRVEHETAPVLKRHYVTFGQKHVHRVNGKTFDCDTIAVWNCASAVEGRKRAFELFGDQFFTDYHGENWEEEDQLHYFPKGYVEVDLK